MCKFTNKLKEPVNEIGYKVATLIDGKYYSPVTGIEYKVGKVESITTYGKNALWKELCWNNILSPDNYFNKPSYHGNTAIFTNYRSAHDLRINMAETVKTIQFVVLEMGIAATYVGEFNCSNFDWIPVDVYIGDEILSMKQIN